MRLVPPQSLKHPWHGVHDMHHEVNAQRHMSTTQQVQQRYKRPNWRTESQENIRARTAFFDHEFRDDCLKRMTMIVTLSVVWWERACFKSLVLASWASWTSRISSTDCWSLMTSQSWKNEQFSCRVTVIRRDIHRHKPKSRIHPHHKVPFQ